MESLGYRAVREECLCSKSCDETHFSWPFIIDLQMKTVPFDRREGLSLPKLALLPYLHCDFCTAGSHGLHTDVSSRLVLRPPKYDLSKRSMLEQSRRGERLRRPERIGAGLKHGRDGMAVFQELCLEACNDRLLQVGDLKERMRPGWKYHRTPMN